jgi:hypothetical protein
MIPALVQRQLQARVSDPPPKIHSTEELDAYLKKHIAELDALVADVEKEIEKLATAKKAEEKELRAWFKGALRGLQLARGSWSWWAENG